MKKLIILLTIILTSFQLFGQNRRTFDQVDIQVINEQLRMKDSVVNAIYPDTLINKAYVDNEISNITIPQPVDSLSLTEGTDTGFSPYKLVTDTANGAIAAYSGESETKLQIGQEVLIYGRNATGTTMTDFTVVYVDSCADCNYPIFRRAIANDPSIAAATYGVTTHDIESGTLGYATRFGIINTDVSGFDYMAGYYLSPYDSGQVVPYAPISPYYRVQVGRVIKTGVNGKFGVALEPFTGNDTQVASNGILNGIVLEKQSIRDTIISNVLYFETNNELRDTINLPFMYQKDIYQLNTTSGAGKDGRAQVALTYGTENAPQKNYIYIDNSGADPVLAVSTTAFPDDGVRVAECGVFDQTTHETYGFEHFQRWNNSVDGSTTDGWVSKSAKNSRLSGTRWFSGVDPTVTIVTSVGLDSLNVYTTSGVVPQFNFQNFDAQTEKKYYWFNAPGGGKWIDDLNEVDSTADGEAMRANNSRYAINVFGIQNSGSFEDYLLVSVSNQEYATDEGCINDGSNYSVTTVPDNVRFTAFRLLRLALRYNTTTGGTITNLLGAGEYQNERGQPLGQGGGGSGTSNITTDYSDAEFSIYNSADPTKIIDFNASDISTGTTRTITMPDTDVTLINKLATPTANKIPYWSDSNTLTDDTELTRYADSLVVGKRLKADRFVLENDIYLDNGANDASFWVNGNYRWRMYDTYNWSTQRLFVGSSISVDTDYQFIVFGASTSDYLYKSAIDSNVLFKTIKLPDVAVEDTALVSIAPDGKLATKEIVNTSDLDSFSIPGAIIAYRLEAEDSLKIGSTWFDENDIGNISTIDSLTEVDDLQAGDSTNLVVMWDTTENKFRYAELGVSSGGGSYTFTNGLTESGGTVKLGGVLTENTRISGSNDYRMYFDSLKFLDVSMDTVNRLWDGSGDVNFLNLDQFFIRGCNGSETDFIVEKIEDASFYGLGTSASDFRVQDYSKIILNADDSVIISGELQLNYFNQSSGDTNALILINNKVDTSTLVAAGWALRDELQSLEQIMDTVKGEIVWAYMGSDGKMYYPRKLNAMYSSQQLQALIEKLGRHELITQERVKELEIKVDLINKQLDKKNWLIVTFAIIASMLFTILAMLGLNHFFRKIT